MEIVMQHFNILPFFWHPKLDFVQFSCMYGKTTFAHPPVYATVFLLCCLSYSRACWMISSSNLNMEPLLLDFLETLIDHVHHDTVLIIERCIASIRANVWACISSNKLRTTPLEEIRVAKLANRVAAVTNALHHRFFSSMLLRFLPFLGSENARRSTRMMAPVVMYVWNGRMREEEKGYMLYFFILCGRATLL
jgi:hypothetical protein